MIHCEVVNKFSSDKIYLRSDSREIIKATPVLKHTLEI